MCLGQIGAKVAREEKLLVFCLFRETGEEFYGIVKRDGVIAVVWA